jgi:SSS family solute:Na+ symporter
MSANPSTLIVFFALFVFVAAVGLFGGRWRAGDLSQLAEWGLGGRRFGTVITWFLIGGDLYTAYTFIAVPALMFGAGAGGFFAVPYATLMYPLLFIAFPRLWSVAHAHGYVTAADFVRGRFGSRPLALAVAITGIVATMPYIALQLLGMQVVIAALGLNYAVTLPLLGPVSVPLLAAFVVLAAYTYNSGLRGTALIAVVKDMLVYATVLAAIIVIPAELGGYGKVFAAVNPKTLLLGHGTATNLGPEFAYVSLSLGSTLALFMYPHAVTGLLSASSRKAIRRNAMILPAYSMALALIALLGFMAVAIFSPAISTRNSLRRIARPSWKHASPSWRRWPPRSARCCSCWACRRLTPSSCNCWAASGSARRYRRCCWACMCGLIPGACWQDGQRALLRAAPWQRRWALKVQRMCCICLGLRSPAMRR